MQPPVTISRILNCANCFDKNDVAAMSECSRCKSWMCCKCVDYVIVEGKPTVGCIKCIGSGYFRERAKGNATNIMNETSVGDALKTGVNGMFEWLKSNNPQMFEEWKAKFNTVTWKESLEKAKNDIREKGMSVLTK